MFGSHTVVVCVLAVVLAVPSVAWAQRSVADVLGRTATPEGQAKRFLEEVVLFSYIENSYVFNLGNVGRDGVNELRYYDFDEGYTFNMAEFSIKKDPSDRYPFGFGLVLTAGLDAQKNHAIGIFRDDESRPTTSTSRGRSCSPSPPRSRTSGPWPATRRSRGSRSRSGPWWAGTWPMTTTTPCR